MYLQTIFRAFEPGAFSFPPHLLRALAEECSGVRIREMLRAFRLRLPFFLSDPQEYRISSTFSPDIFLEEYVRGDIGMYIRVVSLTLFGRRNLRVL